MNTSCPSDGIPNRTRMLIYIYIYIQRYRNNDIIIIICAGALPAVVNGKHHRFIIYYYAYTAGRSTVPSDNVRYMNIVNIGTYPI